MYVAAGQQSADVEKTSQLAVGSLVARSSPARAAQRESEFTVTHHQRRAAAAAAGSRGDATASRRAGYLLLWYLHTGGRGATTVRRTS